MNFNGVFDEWNYMTVKEIEESVREMVVNQTMRLSQSEVDSYKAAWVKKPQFMDYVVRGMRNFLKSPFNNS